MEGPSKFDEDEDIHICGSCGSQFSDVEYFISHKKHSCPVRLARLQSERSHGTQDKLKPGPTELGSSIDHAIQETVQPMVVEHIQPVTDYSAEPAHYMQTVRKEGESLDYLQTSQIGSQTVSTPCEQFVTQSDYTASDNDGQGTGMAHEYVLLSGPASEEPYTGQDQTFDQQEASETVYTLDSHTLQTGLHPISDQTMSTTGETLYQSTLQASQALTSQPDLVSQTGSTTLHLNNINNSLLTRTENQSIVRAETAVNQPSGSISVSVPVQDGYITSSDQNSEIRYTLSIDSQGQAHMSDVQETVDTSSYNPDQNQSHDGSESDMEVLNSSKSKLNENIQYTLTTVASDPAENENIIVIQNQKQPVDVQFENRESVKKASKKSPGTDKRPKPVLEKKFKCTYQDCRYKSGYMKDLERHMRIHTGEKPFKCSKCDKAFNRSDKLLLHMKYHLNQRAFKCTLCDYSAVESGSLKKHMMVHADDRPFSCQVCPYKSRSSSQLQIHLRTHTGDTPYNCGICGSEFKVGSDLTRHMRVHTGEKPFKCEYQDCHYRCAIKSNLRSHYKSHHKDEPAHACDSCEYKSSSKKALFEHKKTHNVNVDLMCEICSYQCSNRSALKNHRKMHSTEEKYKCNHCKYSSIQSGNVQAHMKRKHPVKIPRKIVRKSRLLSKLEYKQTVEESVEEKSAKGNIRTKCHQNFKCDRCSAAFVREDSLKCHVKQHKDSSLSTAYAVLKLQQPVINTSLGQTIASVPPDIEAHTNTLIQNNGLYLQEQTQATNLIKSNVSKPPVLFHDGSFQADGTQATSLHNQTVNLGINDILLAAGVSNLNSNGDSPTGRPSVVNQSTISRVEGNKVLSAYEIHRHLEPSCSQPAISDMPQTDNVDQASSLLSPAATASDVHNMLLGQSPQDVPSVQVMQNISLPYIRLPNGQVLILTGQNSLGQLVTQSDTLAQPDLSPAPIPIQNQIYAQQPTTEQQQLIQSPADSTSPTIATPQISAPQQTGAIPIQIILPNDSQQAIPLVSQLLNSVINRGATEVTPSDTVGPEISSAGMNKTTMSGGVQNFVLQIPTQPGAAKDSDGSLTESQQFVLQISGQGNFNS